MSMKSAERKVNRLQNRSANLIAESGDRENSERRGERLKARAARALARASRIAYLVPERQKLAAESLSIYSELAEARKDSTGRHFADMRYLRYDKRIEELKDQIRIDMPKMRSQLEMVLYLTKLDYSVRSISVLDWEKKVRRFKRHLNPMGTFGGLEEVDGRGSRLNPFETVDINEVAIGSTISSIALTNRPANEKTSMPLYRTIYDKD